MTVVSVVVPTLTGREDLEEQARAAFKETCKGTEIEWILVKDKGVAGEAWNAGADLATGDFLMLACDDMVPHSGWLEAAVTAASEGVYPAPRIVNVDGALQNCGTFGGGMTLGELRDGASVPVSEIPFVKREWWQKDACLPIHYYSDDWLGFLARESGLRVEVRRDYCFTHLGGTVGRDLVVGRKAMEDRADFLIAVTERLSDG